MGSDPEGFKQIREKIRNRIGSFGCLLCVYRLFEKEKTQGIPVNPGKRLNNGIDMYIFVQV
jgi:hypothetical protein